MKRLLLVLLVLITTASVNAQDDKAPEVPPNGWKKEGNIHI